MSQKFFLDEAIFEEHLFKKKEASQQLLDLITLQSKKQVNCYILRATLTKIYNIDNEKGNKIGSLFQDIFGVINSFDEIKNDPGLEAILSEGLPSKGVSESTQIRQYQLATFLDGLELVNPEISAETLDVTEDVTETSKDTVEKDNQDFGDLLVRSQSATSGIWHFAVIGMLFSLKSIVDSEVERWENEIKSQEKSTYFSFPFRDISGTYSRTFPEINEDRKNFIPDLFGGSEFTARVDSVATFSQEYLYLLSSLSETAGGEIRKEVTPSDDSSSQDSNLENSKVLDAVEKSILGSNSSEFLVALRDQNIPTHSDVRKEFLLEKSVEISKVSSSPEVISEATSFVSDDLVEETSDQEFFASLAKDSEELELGAESSEPAIVTKDIESSGSQVKDVPQSEPSQIVEPTDLLEDPQLVEIPNLFDIPKPGEGLDFLDEPELVGESDPLDKPEPPIPTDDDAFDPIIAEPKLIVTESFLRVSEVQSQFSVKVIADREAAFDNLVGLFTVEDENGTVKDSLTGRKFLPGDWGYREAALSNRLGQEFSVGLNGSQIESTLVFSQDSIFGFYIVADGVNNQLQDGSFTSDSSIYFSFSSANSGNTKHVILSDSQALGFEDDRNGDQDFNDIKLHFY